MKFRQGNVFTPVCDSVYKGGHCPGGSLSRGSGGFREHQGHVPHRVQIVSFSCSFGTPLRKIMDPPLWGSLPRASLSRGVSVQEGLCLGRGLCLRRGSLSSRSLSRGSVYGVCV